MSAPRNDKSRYVQHLRHQSRKIFSIVGITQQTVIADIGAGTGILTKHFVGKAKMVYALEPGAEMRAQLEKTLAGHPLCQISDRRAEQTGLLDHSIDLITVAQAIHHFEPQPARTEFLRILKPGGWLALLRNYGTDAVYEKAVEPLYRNFSTADLYERVMRGSADSYFGPARFQTLRFPFEFALDWEHFLGAALSSALTPDESSPNYGAFESRAREVFDTLSVDGLVKSTGETELMLGLVDYH
jgi:SAM-dependent methyltransferase